MNEPLLLVDTGYLAWHCRYAITDLKPSEQESNFVYFFLNNILKLAKKFKTNKFVFAFDSSTSFRKEIYSNYKNRPKKEEDEELNRLCKSKILEIRKYILPTLGFKNVLYLPGYESDDLISDLVLQNNREMIIISRDNDFYQLLDHCCMWDFKKKKVYTKENLLEEKGVTPEQHLEARYLSGCKSDTVEGIYKIGEVTAIKYILGNLGSHTKAYKDIESEEGKAIAKRNQKLIQLPFNQLDLQIEENEKFSKVRFIELMNEYEMSSIIKNDLDDWVNLFNMKE